MKILVFISFMVFYYLMYRLVYFLFKKYGRRYNVVTVSHVNNMWDSTDETYMGYSVAWIITVPLLLIGYLKKKYRKT